MLPGDGEAEAQVAFPRRQPGRDDQRENGDQRVLDPERENVLAGKGLPLNRLRPAVV